jgi:hypothetical protein
MMVWTPMKIIFEAGCRSVSLIMMWLVAKTSSRFDKYKERNTVPTLGQWGFKKPQLTQITDGWCFQLPHIANGCHQPTLIPCQPIECLSGQPIVTCHVLTGQCSMVCLNTYHHPNHNSDHRPQLGTP